MKINKPLNIKIGFYFLITNIILVLLLGGIFYFSSSSLIIKKDILATTEGIQRRGNYIELYITKIKSLSEIISKDSQVYRYLEGKESANKIEIKNMIENILSTDPYIKSILLIRKDGAIISNEKEIDMKVSSDMMSEEWYVQALKNHMPVLNPVRKQRFSQDNVDHWVVSVSREISDEVGKNLGVLLIDIKYQVLREYLQEKGMEKNEDIVIFDRNERVVYHKDIPCEEREREYLETFKNIGVGYNQRENRVVVRYPIKNTNWILYGVSFLKEIKSLKLHFFELIIFSSLISLIITVVISTFVLKRITKPIQELESHVRKFSNNLSKISLKGDVSEEIISLEKHFNEMVEKINYLREYEINALYSQINPHFLYNTLDTIVWMAEFQDTKKVILITKSLANFFRISLSEGREMITLREEMEHVKEYLYIQKQRYEEKLEYEFDIDIELEDVEVPKIILQPLVENAIYHGIRNIKNRGKILIYARVFDGVIELIVEDNGLGFENENRQKNIRMGGVGIKNVNKRVEFYYGYGYGVRVDREVKMGARVIITLPDRRGLD